MTELEENHVRGLLARIRREDPQTFANLVVDALLAPLAPESVTALKRYDIDKKCDGIILAATGPITMDKIEHIIREAQA